MKKNALAEFRASIHMTQKELAESMGVSRNYIALVERGVKPFSAKLREKLSTLSLKGIEPTAHAPPVPTANSPADPDLKPLVHMVNVAPGEKQAPNTPWQCPYCAKKDKEIDQLKRIVENLSSALAKNNN